MGITERQKETRANKQTNFKQKTNKAVSKASGLIHQIRPSKWFLVVRVFSAIKRTASQLPLSCQSPASLCFHACSLAAALVHTKFDWTPDWKTGFGRVNVYLLFKSFANT